jgi:hypothetical protein
LHRCMAPLMARPPKYIVCVRDPAEALWSFYNFCISAGIRIAVFCTRAAD